jgi:hypothetical protein
MAEAADLSLHARTWQGTHFEIGPPTLQRQEVHQRADGRASENGSDRGLGNVPDRISRTNSAFAEEFCDSVSFASLVQPKEIAVIRCSCLRHYRAARARGWGFRIRLNLTQLAAATVRLDAKIGGNHS